MTYTAILIDKSNGGRSVNKGNYTYVHTHIDGLDSTPIPFDPSTKMNPLCGFGCHDDKSRV